MEFKHLSDVLNIILFMSTGALTLVGLITFFASLTLQPKVNVARDILSEIEETISLKITDSYGEKVVNLFTRYKRICDDEFELESMIIKRMQLGIVLVGVVWLSIPVILIPQFYPLEWIYVLIIVLVMVLILRIFYLLLNHMFDALGMSSLPTYNELLDLNKDHSIDLMELVSKSMKLNVSSGNDKLDIELGFPMIFRGATIVKSISSMNNDDIRTVNLECSDDELGELMDNIKCYRHLSDKYVWYKIFSDFSYENFQNNITFQIDLASQNGVTKSTFNITKSEINDSKRYGVVKSPNHVNLIISKQSDILGVD